jgi:hypothetical protein
VRPILSRFDFRLDLRRPLHAVVAVIGVIAIVSAGVYAAQGPTTKHRKAAVAQTPSWTLEADPGPAVVTAAPKAVTKAQSDHVVKPADEVVTSEELRVANSSPCPSTPRHIVNVRDFGAQGDGTVDDTKAIQRAVNAVAVSGGRVVFPSGVYRAYGVRQDSCVEFRGQQGATLIHPDGLSPGHVVRSRVQSTTGTIRRNSRVLTVASTKGFRPGVLVAIRGAGGRSRVQRNELSADLPPYVTSISVRDAKGLNPHWRNYLVIDNEIVSYNGISGNTLRNVERGLFGTKQALHRAGSIAAQAQRMYAVVVRVSGNKVTLDKPSWASVRGVEVDIGSIGMSVIGLTVDGRRQSPAPIETNPFPLKYELARWVTVRDSTLRNGDHGGISLDMGTRDSRIENNVLADNGNTGKKLGAAIWLYRGATNNLVRQNAITGRTWAGITIDDRSIDSTEWDANSTDNTIAENRIDIAFQPSVRSAGVFVTGTSRNRVLRNIISNARTGVLVARSVQGTIVSATILNTVRDNTLISNKAGIIVSGSDNEFVGNLIRHAETPVLDSGQRNRFVDNTVEA